MPSDLVAERIRVLTGSMEYTISAVSVIDPNGVVTEPSGSIIRAQDGSVWVNTTGGTVWVNTGPSGLAALSGTINSGIVALSGTVNSRFIDLTGSLISSVSETNTSLRAGVTASINSIYTTILAGTSASDAAVQVSLKAGVTASLAAQYTMMIAGTTASDNTFYTAIMAGTSASDTAAQTSLKAGVTASFSRWPSDLSVAGSITGSGDVLLGRNLIVPGYGYFSNANVSQALRLFGYYNTSGANWTVVYNRSGTLAIGGATSVGGSAAQEAIMFNPNNGAVTVLGTLEAVSSSLFDGSITGSGDAAFGRRVGVGVNPPAAELHVRNAVAGTTTDIRLDAPAVTNQAFIRYDDSAQDVSVSMGAATNKHFKINSVGAATVAKDLTVAGSLTGSGDALFSRAITGSGFLITKPKSANVDQSSYFGGSGIANLTVAGYADNNGSAQVWHNAYSAYNAGGDATPKFQGSHSTFGARGIQFAYGAGRGIYFYADTTASNADVVYSPTRRMLISNEGWVVVDGSLTGSGDATFGRDLAVSRNVTVTHDVTAVGSLTGSAALLGATAVSGDRLVLDMGGDGTAGHYAGLLFRNTTNYNTWIRSVMENSSPSFLNPQMQFGVQLFNTLGLSNTPVQMTLRGNGDLILHSGALSVAGSITGSGNATFSQNVSMGAGVGSSHSVLGTINVNGTVGNFGDVLTNVLGTPRWATPGAAFASGSGLTNKIVKWGVAAATQSITDSTMTDNGYSVEIAPIGSDPTAGNLQTKLSIPGAFYSCSFMQGNSGQQVTINAGYPTGSVAIGTNYIAFGGGANKNTGGVFIGADTNPTEVYGNLKVDCAFTASIDATVLRNLNVGAALTATLISSPTLDTLSGTIDWQRAADGVDFTRGSSFFDDFLNTLHSNFSIGNTSLSGSDPGHPGILKMSVSTSASVAQTYVGDAMGSSTAFVLPGSGRIQYETCLRKALVDDAINNGQVRAGIFGTAGNYLVVTPPGNGVYFELDRTRYGDNEFRFCCAATGSRVQLKTGVTAANLRWYRLLVEWSPNADAVTGSIYCSGTLISTVTNRTYVPAQVLGGTLMVPQISHVKTLGSAAVNCDVDYHSFRQTFSASRI